MKVEKIKRAKKTRNGFFSSFSLAKVFRASRLRSKRPSKSRVCFVPRRTTKAPRLGCFRSSEQRPLRSSPRLSSLQSPPKKTRGNLTSLLYSLSSQIKMKNEKKVLRPLHGLVQGVPRLPRESRNRGAGLGLRPLLRLLPRRRQRPLREGPRLLAQQRRERRRGDGSGDRPPARRRRPAAAAAGLHQGGSGLVGRAEADLRGRRQERRGSQPGRQGERQRRDAPYGRREEGRRSGGFFLLRCCCFRSELFEVCLLESVAVCACCRCRYCFGSLSCRSLVKSCAKFFFENILNKKKKSPVRPSPRHHLKSFPRSLISG